MSDLGERTLLSFSVHWEGPQWLDERLNVEGDQARYVVQAASAPAWLARAGTFGSGLGRAFVDRLTALATALCRLPDPPDPIAGQLVVEASCGDRRVAVGLSGPVPSRPLTAPESEARQAFLDLAAHCGRHPIRAVELSASLGPGTAGPDGPSSLRFRLTNPGPHEEVGVRVDPAQVQGRWRSSTGPAGTTAGPNLILVDGDGAYLGGVMVPARIPPGQAACGVLVDSIPPATPPNTVEMSVAGSLVDRDCSFRVQVKAGAT